MALFAADFTLSTDTGKASLIAKPFSSRQSTGDGIMNDTEFFDTVITSSNESKPPIEGKMKLIAHYTNDDRDNVERYLDYRIYERENGRIIMTTFAQKDGEEPVFDYFCYKRVEKLAEKLRDTKTHRRLLEQVGAVPLAESKF
jgi:hypothetical protein